MAELDVALDDDLDIAFPTRCVSGRELFAQRIRVRIATHKGEILRDGSLGLPWVDWFGQKPFPVTLAAASIRRTIETIPGNVRAPVVTVAPPNASGEVVVEVDAECSQGTVRLRQVLADGGTKNMSFAAVWYGFGG